MTKRTISFLATLAVTVWCGVTSAWAQGSPDMVWEVPTPGGLANSVVGVGWAPGSVGHVAMGSTDRWLRARQASDGALIYSILGPQHSRGGDQTIYSNDGMLLAVHSIDKGLDYRVYRVADGVWLGTILVSFDSNGLVQFTPDAQLQASIPGGKIMARFRLEEFNVVFTIGSGYRTTTTTFNFSPRGIYQSIAAKGDITIKLRKDASVVSSFQGGAVHGSTPMNFSPDGNSIAAWDGDSNQTTLWRVSDGSVLMQFPDAVPEEGISAIRFSPDGTRLITTGYLAINPTGTWEQFGIIRFWRVADGVMRHQFDQHTGIGVTSPIAWSPDASQFVYGTYEGTVAVANTPAP